MPMSSSTATGQYVHWTNNTGQNITAINLRSCIPDAPTGGGITYTIDLYVNGVFRQAFSVNSQQNYCYEGTNYNGQTDKNPADGDPRGFWNDTHAFISGAAVAPGETINFRWIPPIRRRSTILTWWILETPPAAAEPAGQFPLHSQLWSRVKQPVAWTTPPPSTTASARPRRRVKSPGYRRAPFTSAPSTAGSNASGITIEGAGPWYSTIYRVTPANNTQGVANIITTTSSTLENVCSGLQLAQAGRATTTTARLISAANNWVVNNVWIQHVTSSFWCAGVDGTAENCRALSTWADGGNFNNVQSANGIGMNLTYSNNFVRGTGR